MSENTPVTFVDDPAIGDRPPDALSILCVLPTLNPYGGVISAVNALNILTDVGHRVTMASLSLGDPGRVFPRVEPVLFEDQYHAAQTIVGSFDILLATSWETVRPVVDVGARMPGARAVYFVQDFEADFYPATDGETRERVLATYNMIPDRVVKTEYLQQRLGARGWESHRILPGMDLDLFYPRPRGNASGIRVLAMARPGTPNDHRGYAILVDVFAELRRRRPDLELAVFGSASLPGMDSEVVAFGRLGPEALPALYSSASVFIDTSLVHGFGRTGLEAMACGVPCVLSDSGGISEYAKHNENCLIVPVGDVEASVGAVELLLDKPNTTSRLVEGGLRTAARYSDYDAAFELLEVFHKVMMGEKGSGI